MIREFGLYLNDGIGRSISSKFAYETRSVLALYERYFTPPSETGKAWKISVEIVPQVKKPDVRELLGNLHVQIKDNPLVYFDLNAQEKKHQTLNWLFRGIEMVTQDRMWDLKPYEEARQAVLDLDFVNRWTWRKRAWWRNGRRLAAEVFVEHEIEEVHLYIQLRKRSGEILQKTLVVSDMPDEFVFNRYFGMLQWIDDTTVRLSPKFGEGSWSVTFDQRHFPQ